MTQLTQNAFDFFRGLGVAQPLLSAEQLRLFAAVPVVQLYACRFDNKALVAFVEQVDSFVSIGFSSSFE